MHVPLEEGADKSITTSTVASANVQGMVDAGEAVSQTLKREFGEEALNSLETTEQEKKDIETHINELFKAGDKVYNIIIHIG